MPSRFGGVGVEGWDFAALSERVKAQSEQLRSHGEALGDKLMPLVSEGLSKAKLAAEQAKMAAEQLSLDRLQQDPSGTDPTARPDTEVMDPLQCMVLPWDEVVPPSPRGVFSTISPARSVAYIPLPRWPGHESFTTARPRRQLARRGSGVLGGQRRRQGQVGCPSLISSSSCCSSRGASRQARHRSRRCLPWGPLGALGRRRGASPRPPPPLCPNGRRPPCP
jgi:hypothetical protein